LKKGATFEWAKSPKKQSVGERTLTAERFAFFAFQRLADWFEFTVGGRQV